MSGWRDLTARDTSLKLDPMLVDLITREEMGWVLIQEGPFTSDMETVKMRKMMTRMMDLSLTLAVQFRKVIEILSHKLHSRFFKLTNNK